MNCPKCKILVVSRAFHCVNCGAKLRSRPAEPANVIPDNPPSKHVLDLRTARAEMPQSREHGFRRLGIEIGDPEAFELCEQGANTIPIDHPVEQMAGAVAETLAFSKTPGGAHLLEGLKKGLSKIFGG